MYLCVRVFALPPSRFVIVLFISDMIDADAFASSNLRSRPHITGYVYDVERRVGGGVVKKGGGSYGKKQ